MNDKAARLLAKIRDNRARRPSAAQEFAASKGWRVSKPFDVTQLFARPGTTRDRSAIPGERRDYFTDSGFPVAVVMHGTYNDAAIARRYAERHRLRLEELASWHRPDACALLIQRPEWTYRRVS